MSAISKVEKTRGRVQSRQSIRQGIYVCLTVGTERVVFNTFSTIPFRLFQHFTHSILYSQIDLYITLPAQAKRTKVLSRFGALTRLLKQSLTDSPQRVLMGVLGSQLSVKILVISQLSVKNLAISQLSVNFDRSHSQLSVNILVILS